MKNVNSITMNFEEFKDYIEMVSNGEVTVEECVGDWCYTTTEQ